MSDNHLTVPESSDTSILQDNSFAGRRRSGSQRSQLSGHSQRSGPQPTAEVHDYTRRPSIRLRGFSAIQEAQPSNASSTTPTVPTQNARVEGSGVTRSRSISAPQRVGAVTTRVGPVTTTTSTTGTGVTTTTTVSHMPTLAESVPEPPRLAMPDEIIPTPTPVERPASSWMSLRRSRTGTVTGVGARDFANRGQDEYESDLVDYLDTIDPEVQTLNTLNNVQNSLFVPDLGRYLNRRPTYTLTRGPTDVEEQTAATLTIEEEAERGQEGMTRRQAQRVQSTATLDTINSRVNDKFYAVLPHGVSLQDWTEEEKMELNDHVRHMLHSKKSRFKRSMKGFGQYVRKPLGAFVTIYATLITLFGLAWVLFLIGWVNVGGRQLYIINVIDNVLVALFALIGDGLAPFRTVDTYHMIFIAHYHHLTWRLRREKHLPQLEDHNDLPPLATNSEIADPEKQEISVLSEEQQRKLAHHQGKFSKSHSFYKPHETATHHAFPLRLLVAIVVLLDCHSLLQISLGACTWGIYYKRRPFALTTVILCCSITCNITAGILISVGDRKTRKKDVLERISRQELTRHAIKKVENHRKERQSMDLIREQNERQSMELQRLQAGIAAPQIRGESSGIIQSTEDEHQSKGIGR